jgi:hypothetical protein
MDVLINNNIIKEINVVDNNNNNNNNIEEETNSYFCSMQMVGTLDQKQQSSCYFGVIIPLLSFNNVINIFINIIGIISLAVRVRGGIGDDDGITLMLSVVPPHTTGKTGETKKFERNATGVTVDTRLEHQNKPVSFADHQDRQRQLCVHRPTQTGSGRMPRDVTTLVITAQPDVQIWIRPSAGIR